MNFYQRLRLALYGFQYFGIRKYTSHVLSRLIPFKPLPLEIPYQLLMKSAVSIHNNHSSLLKTLGFTNPTLELDDEIEEIIVSGKLGSLSQEWNSNRETLYLLCNLANILGAKSIIEIGTGNGLSTSALAIGLKRNGSGKVFSFDVRREAGGSIPAHLSDFIELINVDSRFGSKDHEVRSIFPKPDICFIDGAHDYFNVRLDIELSLNQKPSILVVDDIEVKSAFFDACKIKDLDYRVLLDGRKVIGVVDLRFN